MRAILFVALLAAAPVWADGPRSDDCAISTARACPVEVLLPGLELLDAASIPMLDQITVLAKSGQGIVAVDLAVADGALRRTLPLNTGAGDLATDTGLIGSGLIGLDAQGYLLHIRQADGTELGLLFLGRDGERLALMPPSSPSDWSLEISLAEAVMLLARQGALTYDGAALQGLLYRFRLRIKAADGKVVLDELQPPMTPGDTLAAYLERRLAQQIDPVGYEDIHQEGRLSAVTTSASDGSPSRVLLRSSEGGEIAFDQRLGASRLDYDYQAARVTLDGRYLAAIRSSVDDEMLLMVFDTTTTQPVFQAPLAQAYRSQLLWLQDGRIVVLQQREGEGINVLVLDPGR